MFTFRKQLLGRNEVEVVEAYLQTAGIAKGTLNKIRVDLWGTYDDLETSIEMDDWLEETRQTFDLEILTDAAEIIFGDGDDVHSQDEGSMETDEEKQPLTLTTFDKRPRPGSPDPYKSQKGEDEQPLSKADRKRFLELWGGQLQAYRKRLPKKAKEKRQKELDNSESDERHLARIAWVLDKLNARRVCVAVLLTSDYTFYVYANVIDDSMSRDVKRLVQATRDRQTYLKLKEDVIQATLAELRGQKGSTDKKTAKARRRLNKALRFLQRFENPSFHIHQPQTRDKHAEMRAADAARASGSIGISKLCCGKCTMALVAFSSVKKIRFEVLGTHLKTYSSEAGWPIPAFLGVKGAMQIFLGEEAYKMYQLSPFACDHLIVEEELTMKTLKPFKETDIVSSQESQASLSMASQQSQDFAMEEDIMVLDNGGGSEGEGESDDEDDIYDNEDDKDGQDLFEEERMEV